MPGPEEKKHLFSRSESAGKTDDAGIGAAAAFKTDAGADAGVGIGGGPAGNEPAGDTIAAVATPLAEGGIGVLRISGRRAFGVAQCIFRAKSGRPVAGMRPYTAALGTVVSADGRETLDEAIALVFRAPRSYTGEDVVELSCHGGVYLMRRVLSEAVRAGARAAGRGEFTKRAFLNGKMDLTRAESVMQLVTADSDAALRAAESQREGRLYDEIASVSGALMKLASDLAAWVDFPDEDIPSVRPAALLNSLEAQKSRLGRLAETYGEGRVVREGASVVLAGRPNAGKSTLMNRLTGHDRSIVSSLPGTTRDVVEEEVRMGGLALRLSDTAGLRETSGEVEKIGVERARKSLRAADLVLAVFDGSSPLGRNDRSLLRALKGRRAIAALNKSDLGEADVEPEISESVLSCVRVSARTGDGVDKLKAAIVSALGGVPQGAALIANDRQLGCVVRSQAALESACGALRSGMTLDAVSVCLDDALNALGELTGKRAGQQVIDRVFERFCVGK